jgi:phosphoribosylcarboxyaminoimidazole (NCAIR) mutase
MEQLNHVATIIALTMGVAWASGINLYASITMLGILGATGSISLPPDLQILMNPLVIMAAGFVVDKVPGVDSGWDALHTFIRIPAGAALAAGAVGHVHPAVALAAAIVGGRHRGRDSRHEGWNKSPDQRVS